MAKRTTKLTAPTSLIRISVAAKEVGMRQSTIFAAVKRGEIEAYRTGCGLPLVYLPEVKRWVAAAGTRKRGRKPKEQ